MHERDPGQLQTLQDLPGKVWTQNRERLQSPYRSRFWNGLSTKKSFWVIQQPE